MGDSGGVVTVSLLEDLPSQLHPVQVCMPLLFIFVSHSFPQPARLREIIVAQMDQQFQERKPTAQKKKSMAAMS